MTMSSESTVVFGEKLAGSQTFSETFRRGMGLVEQTAAYLDGPGRSDSKALDRQGALTYATESMRLTTRLMQLASWLLLHRAVNDGEMSLEQARLEKAKVRLGGAEPSAAEALALLPQALAELIQASYRMQDEVSRLDRIIHAEVVVDAPAPEANTVANHLDRLRSAFEAR